MSFKSILVLFLCTISGLSSLAQNPHRFDRDIKRFSMIEVTEQDDFVVFTGSSSIRFWKDLKNDCGRMKLVNTGFGGSHMSDLLYFIDETVLRFKPAEVYIYEGDNDISDGKDPEDILQTTQKVVEKILNANPETVIHFISAKPSPSRWELKPQYLLFNTLLKDYCKSEPQLHYIDVWYPMLNDSGRPNPQIFVKDSLHMNRKGYLIWKGIICE